MAPQLLYPIQGAVNLSYPGLAPPLHYYPLVYPGTYADPPLPLVGEHLVGFPPHTGPQPGASPRPKPNGKNERKRTHQVIKPSPRSHHKINKKESLSGQRIIYGVDDDEIERKMVEEYQKMFSPADPTYVLPTLPGSVPYFKKHFPNHVSAEVKTIMQCSAKRAITLQDTSNWSNISPDELEPVVIYWMSRELRTRHNHGLAMAQAKAFLYDCPLIVYINPDTWAAANMRQFSWRVEALVEVVAELASKNIKTICELPNADFSSFISLQNFRVLVMITDFYPLNSQLKHEDFAMQHVRSTTEVLKCDSHNLVPTWEVSPNLEKRRKTKEAEKKNAARVAADHAWAGKEEEWAKDSNSSDVPSPQLSQSSSKNGSLDGNGNQSGSKESDEKFIPLSHPWQVATTEVASSSKNIRMRLPMAPTNADPPKTKGSLGSLTSRSTDYTEATKFKSSSSSPDLKSSAESPPPQSAKIYPHVDQRTKKTQNRQPSRNECPTDPSAKKEENCYYQEIPRAFMFRRLLTTKLMGFPISELPAPLIAQTKKLRELPSGVFTLENAEDVMSLMHLEYIAVTESAGIVRVNWLKAGQQAAEERLELWIKDGISGYVAGCRDPSANATSLLSPYINHGCISAQYIVYRIETSTAAKKDKEKFSNEIIVWKELSDHYCLYNPDYDTVGCFPPWALETAETQESDREFLYSIDNLEKAQTHDEMWNCTMQELIMFGIMNGQLRLYWAKKIIEWTGDKATALKYCLELNDKWALDGNDPIGYCTTSWAIGGTFDRAFPTLPIYGQIRSITRRGMNRHFDTTAWTKERTLSWKLFIEGSRVNANASVDHYLMKDNFNYDKEVFKSCPESPIYEKPLLISQRTCDKLDNIIQSLVQSS